MNSLPEIASNKIQETPPQKSIIPEKQIPQIEEVAKPIIQEEKTKNEIIGDTTLKQKAPESSIIYSVQIGANTTPIDPVASNFKGVKNVRREKTDKYYRYYVGNENSLEKATLVLQQIKQKFPQAFIVSFVDGRRVPIN